MRVSVDTSAFLAIMDVDEQNHATAKQVWEQLIDENTTLICTNYVLVETIALVQRRFGVPLVKAFQERVTPILHIAWVDESLHQAGLVALLTANRRQLSLVDCISFETARRLDINTIFAFDQHFAEQGFTCLS
jgi:predicted nucleic acid-binding protein